MILETIDWIIIIAYFALSLGIGLAYSRSAGKSLDHFFLGGRQMGWFLAGISMVATTFAADTPLAVTELVGQSGIAGNWLWWSFLSGGMLTTFFFAKLWRRAEVMTEVELIELRYGGQAARFLRGFKAVYLGLFMNVIIIAWVNVALISILKGFFNLDDNTALLYTGLAMLITAFYSSISGLMGVAVTDAVQFGIAMLGCIILAVLVVNSPQIGGIVGLKAKVPASALEFFPHIGNETNPIAGLGQTLSLSVGAFLSYIGVQWWASWYPGAEPGGGGYVAQRFMSTKSEKDAVYATLFFQIAHYCLRPWPWILVALCVIVLYPDLKPEEVKMGYIYAMRDFLPAGFRGMLLVAFLAAYMSTIATQLNWGASYLVNDLYRRFIRPIDSFENKTLYLASAASDDIAIGDSESDKHYVLVSRLTTLALMILGLIVTTQITSISGAWGFIMQCGAGLGLVLILRWYWWRINVWSEISATIAPFVMMIFLNLVGNKEWLAFPNSFLATVAFTTVVWLVVTLLTKPEDYNVLRKFYEKVQPDGAWRPFFKYHTSYKYDKATLNDNGIFVDIEDFLGGERRGTLFSLIMCWLSSIILIYSSLFFMGKIIFIEYQEAAIFFGAMVVSFLTLRFFLSRTQVLH